MSQLPDYVASAKPNPFENRAPWLTTTAATYAGIMLWFVFWQDVPTGGAAVAGGVLSQGLLFALISLVFAAFICYTCFYHVPAILGMKTGLPLYIVGTSTYGVTGGFLMPGFLMGCLQFGWLSVNGYFAGAGLTSIWQRVPMDAVLGAAPWKGETANMTLWSCHMGIGIVWAVIAAFVGLKGIKYVGMIASYMPIIPIAALLYLLYCTIGNVGAFNPVGLVDPHASGKVLEDIYNTNVASLYGSGILGSVSGQLGVLSLICAYVVGFFATAGAAGCDFGSNNKDRTAVKRAGFVGIVGATIFTGAIALIAVAGSQYTTGASLNPYNSLKAIMGEQVGGIFTLLLAIAAFPSACFSTLIASNSFKTTLPKTNPFISCGIGTLVACGLILSGFAGQAGNVFILIGASFGPVCGAMMADYLLSGKKWAGPRAGFNPAGWISWVVGFIVGGITLFGSGAFGYGKFVIKFDLPFTIPCPPVSAFVVGLVLYFILAKMGLESKKLDMPQRIDK